MKTKQLFVVAALCVATLGASAQVAGNGIPTLAEETNTMRSEADDSNFTSAFMAGPGISFSHYDTDKISLLRGGHFETFGTSSQEYTNNAENDGCYMSSFISGPGMSFSHYATEKISILGGVNFETYKTDSKIDADSICEEQEHHPDSKGTVQTDTVFVCTSPEVLSALNAKAVNTIVNEKLIDKDGSRDAYIVQSQELANYQQEVGQSTKFDGNIPVGKASNKFGWSVEAFAGVGYENSVKPLAGLGFVYTRRLWH